MTDSKSSFLKLVKTNKTNEETPNAVVPPLDELEVSEQQRRGKLFDVVLGSLRSFAREKDPSLTVTDAAELLVELPLFLTELQANWRGTGLLREMPNVPGQETYPNRIGFQTVSTVFSHQHDSEDSKE